MRVPNGPVLNKWIDEAGHDPAWYIFYELYECYIPVMDMRTVEDIQMFGVPISGDAYYDKQMATENRLIKIPIHRIMEYQEQGARIAVRYRPDTKKIYDRIQKHLLSWMEHLKTSLNVPNPPLEELRRLDRFAGVVYEFAKYHFDETVVSSFLTRQQSPHARNLYNTIEALNNIPIVNGEFVLPRQQSAASVVEKEYATRESLATAFIRPDSIPGYAPSLNTAAGQAMNQAQRQTQQPRPTSLAELITRGRAPLVIPE